MSVNLSGSLRVRGSIPLSSTIEIMRRRGAGILEAEGMDREAAEYAAADAMGLLRRECLSP
jgi:hypothetical protein